MSAHMTTRSAGPTYCWRSVRYCWLTLTALLAGADGTMAKPVC
jgi:hypothetical protein